MGFPGEMGSSVAGARVQATVRLIDVLPTLLDYLDLEGAEKAFRRILEGTDPPLGVYHWYSQILAYTGRRRESVSLAREALALDSLDRRSKVVLALHLANHQGKNEESLRLYEELESEWPDPVDFLQLKSVGYEAMGLVDEAVSMYRQLLQDPVVRGSPYSLGYIGGALGRAGYKDEAAEILNELIERREAGELVGPMDLAWVYIGLDQHEQALDCLEQAYAERHFALPYMNSYMFEDLRGNPRFEELRRSVFGKYAVG